jgi:hypothetical protein
MKSIRRTSRIQFRCTPAERINILAMAEELKLTACDFLRDSVTIAIASNPNARQWDKKLATAIMKIANQSPWTTS